MMNLRIQSLGDEIGSLFRKIVKPLGCLFHFSLWWIGIGAIMSAIVGACALLSKLSDWAETLDATGRGILIVVTLTTVIAGIMWLAWEGAADQTVFSLKPKRPMPTTDDESEYDKN